jgi:hypothetical protein
MAAVMPVLVAPETPPEAALEVHPLAADTRARLERWWPGL